MGEHTPGPWTWDCGAVRTTRGIIAQCPTPQKGGVFDCVANARLIAACPTMYEFIASRAEAGDEAARKIMEALNATAR